MERDRNSVAVIGLGALGLVAVKNLMEEGFDVTGFDKNEYVGGLWHYTEENKTSVLPTTIVNISKERGCYTDFPFPDSAPSHCNAKEVEEYLERYADHFRLRPSLRLNTTVTAVKRDNSLNKWAVYIDGEAPMLFDRVVLAAGMNEKPHIPKLPGANQFTGDYVHSQAFKSGAPFKGKRVIVVGLGNTGADTVEALRGHADKIYLSHNHGGYVLSRLYNGQSLDHSMTLRKINIMGFFDNYLPTLGEKLTNSILTKMQNATFNILPEWRISPAPSVKHGVPIISENLVRNFADGTVTSIQGLKRVINSNTVEPNDGTQLEVDSIVWCTGYRADFSILDPDIDPTRNTTPRWKAAKGSRGKPLPRLYQNVISTEYPDSLAILGSVAFATAAFQLYDIVTMCVAQIWAGKSSLPSPKEMERAVDAQHAWICRIAEQGTAIPSWVRHGDWLAWADKTAGTGLSERLGWGVAGWRFWYQERELYKMLMDGIASPHIYRLFDGKRKKWDGAEEELVKVNRRVSEAQKKKAD